MKRKLTNILSISVLVLLAACSKPNPIELEQNNSTNDDSYSLEIISTDPNQFDYQNGYDSTGIANPLPRASAEFIISLYKNSGEMHQGMGNRIGIASAAFYDKSNPIYDNNNRLVGYKTEDLGQVKFNRFPAMKRPFRIRFRESGAFTDSTIGIRYHLPIRPMMNIENGIDITLENNNQTIFESYIQVPAEITGSLERIIDGSRLSGLNLTWNGLNRGKIDIIVGGFVEGSMSPLPLIRLKVADDGKFILPKNILDQVPYKNFESVVFSFIRKLEKSESSNSLSDNYIAAQSIHNIRINLNN